MATTPTLPTVSLKDVQVAPAVLKRVSLETMKRFQVAAFEENEKDLKLAIVYPEQLKQGFFTALKDMESKVGRTVKLYKTDPQSFDALLKQYPQDATSTPTGATAPAAPAKSIPVVQEKKNTTPPPPPPLFKLGQQVALNYLKRVPLDYAEAHRLVSVDFFPPSTYWFLTDGTKGEETERLVKEIEKTNSITVHLISIKENELDDLLAYYADKLVMEKKDQENAKKREQQQMPSPAFSDGASKTAKADTDFADDVTVPDLQAAIISKEEEKGGIAGIFQRVAQTLNAPKVDESKDEHAKQEENQQAEQKPAEQNAGGAQAPAPAPNGSPPANPPSAVVPAALNATKPADMVKPEAPVNDPKVAPSPGQPAQNDNEGEIGKLLDQQVATVEELKEHIKKGFIPRIVAATVSFAIHEKASDIHVEAFEDEVRIRFRVDGQLLDIVKLPPDVHAAMVSRIKILSRLRLDETRIPQDGRFDVAFNETQVDLRVSVMPTVHGEKVVMRILDKGKGVTSLEKLGIEGLGYQNLMAAIQKPFGVCLATGPTGSGKSTSLYAILNRIATPNVNVVTLEDPVEYEMKGINQAQIRPKIGFTFAEGLRSVLRQDPNIIMVGEIRDGETANMATQAALTGHLVLSTLHTNDAAGAIPRLTNMGIEPFLITSSVNVVIGQRLVRKICSNCKKDVSLPPGFKMQIEEDIAKLAKLNPIDAARLPKEIKFFQGMGCSQCGGKGYQGRLGIYEVLTMTDAIGELTIKHAPNNEIQAQAQKDGMLTMYQDGLIKVVNGTTTLDEVLRETSNK